MLLYLVVTHLNCSVESHFDIRMFVISLDGSHLVDCGAKHVTCHAFSTCDIDVASFPVHSIKQLFVYFI